MMQLRPHQVFDRVTESDRLAAICLPQQHSLTSMLERAILASLLKIMKPRTIFEFGTYLGETTLILAANTNARVFSLDLNEDCLSDGGTIMDEFELVNARKRFSDELVFQKTKYKEQIEILIGDSTTYDFSPFYRGVDFVFIDGGHHINVVDSDTTHALEMISRDHPSCIAWHDYGNPNYRITEYLDQRSLELELYHVAETSLVFSIRNMDINLFMLTKDIGKHQRESE